MAHQTGDRSTGANGGMLATDARDRGRTPAQWYCLLAGAALLLAGLFGFLADATFDTGLTGTDSEGGNQGGALQGDSFLGFEVNGWHNVVHVLSGIVLLAAFARRKSAKTVALAFGLVYGLVAIIGLIDGNDVLGLIPVNAADNVLHIALSLVGILAALASPADDRRRDATGRGSDAGRFDTGTPAEGGHGRSGDEDRFGRDVDPLSGRPRDDRQITSN